MKRKLFVSSYAAGVGVTLYLHRHPSSPWWTQRVGSSRLRRSDLPVVGSALTVVTVGLRRRGLRRTAGVTGVLALGAAAGALSGGLLEPLPRS